MGGVISNITDVFGQNSQERAASHTAQEQIDSQNRSLDMMQQQWQASQDALRPYQQAGTGALNQLSSGLAAGGQFTQGFQYDPNQDPSTQWRLQQGLNAVNSSAAAKGGFFSGQTGLDLNNYAQNFASSEYNNAFNRWKNMQDTDFNRLSSLAGIGQTATTTGVNAGGQAAAGMGQVLQSGAAASGQYNMLGAQYGAGGLNALGNLGGNLANYGSWNSMFGGGGGGGGGDVNGLGYGNAGVQDYYGNGMNEASTFD